MNGTTIIIDRAKYVRQKIWKISQYGYSELPISLITVDIIHSDTIINKRVMCLVTQPTRTCTCYAMTSLVNYMFGGILAFCFCAILKTQISPWVTLFPQGQVIPTVLLKGLRKSIFSPFQELNPSHPPHSQSLYWINYPSWYNHICIAEYSIHNRNRMHNICW